MIKQLFTSISKFNISNILFLSTFIISFVVSFLIFISLIGNIPNLEQVKSVSTLIQEEIITTIDNFEPRVENVQVRVDPRPDVHNFDVTIFFDIVGQELPSQEFSFILEATR